MFNCDEIYKVSKKMRINILKLARIAGKNGSHLGPSLSIVDILCVLYGSIMNHDPKNPLWEDRDIFILSKGHGALAYYTVLYENGYITEEELYSFENNGGLFPAQPSMNPSKGIEFSSGSLGYGLSLGVGVSLASVKKNKSNKTYVLMGDGELNEGTVWESAMIASHFHLKSLIAIVDKNNMQSDGRTLDIMDMGDMSAKWRSFGWEVFLANGHDPLSIYSALSNAQKSRFPSVVIAETIKGKGVSFMENNSEWHHSILSSEQMEKALVEIGYE